MNSLNVHDASDVTCTLSAAWREMMIVNFVSDNTGKLQNLRQTNKEKKNYSDYLTAGSSASIILHYYCRFLLTQLNLVD